MTFDLFSLLDIPWEAWQQTVAERGTKVEAFRNYADGDHPSNLSTPMRKLLRIGEGNGLEEFNANYCDRVIQAMNDRLFVTSILASAMADDDKEPEKLTEDFVRKGSPVDRELNKVIGQLLADVDFDAKQVEAHESAIRDGDAFVLVSGNSLTGEVSLSVEPAFDGVQGMIVLYESVQSDVPEIALKIWNIDLEGVIVNKQRVNVYTATSIKRFTRSNGGALEPYTEDGLPAVLAWPEEIGMPVRHLPNRKKSFDNFGKSEIEDVVPLQNSLNRALYSLVASAELTGFQIRVAKGFVPPAELSPGMWVEINRDGNPLDKEDQVDAYVLKGENPTAFIQAADWLIGQISSVSATPMEFLSSSMMSGEALKQREIALLGKVQRFQVVAGAFWQQVVELMLAVSSYINNNPLPEIEALQITWRDPQIRNDLEASQIITNIAALDILDPATLIELMAPIFDWDGRKVEAIIKRADTHAQAKEAAITALTPTFNTNNNQSGPSNNENDEPDTTEEVE